VGTGAGASSTEPRFTAAGARDRRPTGPRRVRNGIKLRARDGELPTAGLGGALVRIVDRDLDPEEREEGLRYARLGQIVTLEIDAGGPRATVQGEAPRPVETRLAIDVFTAAQWDQIVALMAGEAVYLVKLMANELPEPTDDLLATQGLGLLPTGSGGLEAECTCPTAGVCRHAVAVAAVVAERLMTEPLLALAMRGMPADRLLERLRQARLLLARGVASAHVDPVVPESAKRPPSLEACVDEFWRAGAKLGRSPEGPRTRHVSHALLRRLGPSPLTGKFPLVGLLASIYDHVAAHATDLRERAEQTVDDTGNGDLDGSDAPDAPDA
jgi:uncharacterized Zn finger protein